MSLTIDAIPFSGISSVAGPNEAGDMLVVGAPNAGFVQFLTNFPLQNIPGGNPQICNPVQLAPGLYANAYIPTANERTGDFSAFGKPLVDPATGKPFPQGQIPTARSYPAPNKFPVCPCHIASLAR